jgi:hypothetical protein
MAAGRYDRCSYTVVIRQQGDVHAQGSARNLLAY